MKAMQKATYVLLLYNSMSLMGRWLWFMTLLRVYMHLLYLS
jgi:hypothetical protein